MTIALANPVHTKDASKLMADHYGSAIAFPELLDIDEGRMSVFIPFADGNKRDGVGDLTEVGGIRTDRHRQNPIVLFDHGKGNHKFSTWPVGLCSDRDSGAYTVEIDPHTRLARANAFFYQGKGLENVSRDDDNEFGLYCEQLFDLLAKRFIRGGSFGYQIIDARQLQPDYQTGTPPGQHLLVTLLLELGPVVLPANQDTVRKCLCLGDCCGKPLSPYLKKSFEMYAEPNTKTVTGYEAKMGPNRTMPANHDDRDVHQATASRERGSYLNQATMPANPKKAGGHPAMKPPKPGKDKSYGDVGERLGRAGGAIAGGVATETPMGAIQGSKIGGKIGRSIGSQFDKKALGDLRLKYRNKKGLRRRVKRSRPGASTMWTRDLKGCMEAARKSGLRATHISSHPSGAFKIKMEGMDDAIDSVAKTFGMRGVKSLMKTEPKPKPHINNYDQGLVGPNAEIAKRHSSPPKPKPATGTKAQAIDAPPGAGRERASVSNDTLANSPMGSERILTGAEGATNTNQPLKTVQRKAMKQNTKAMGDDGMSPEDEPVEDRPGEEIDQDMDSGGEGEEKYSLQCLRKLHQDATTLLQQYDEMKGPLEHEGVSAHLQKKLEALVAELEEIEGLKDKHHADAPPLDSGGPTEAPMDDLESTDEEVGDEGEATGDVDDDIPTPEEAVEGMNQKGLGGRQIKTLKAKYKGMHEDGCKCAKCKSFPSTRNDNTRTLGIEGSHKPGFEEHRETGKARGTKAAPPSTRNENTRALGIEGGHKPGFEEFHEEGKKAIGKKSRNLGIGDSGKHEPGMQGALQEGRSNPVCTPDKEGMDGVAGKGKAYPSTEDEGTEDLGIEGEDKPGFEEYHEAGKAQGSKGGLLSHEKIHVKGAHGFLGELAHTQDFGHRHRLDAHHYGKLLDDIGQRFEQQFKSFSEMDQEDGNVNANKPESNEQAEPELEGDEKGLPDAEIRKESRNVEVTQPSGPNSHVKPGQDTHHMAYDKAPGWPVAGGGEKGFIGDAMNTVGLGGKDEKAYPEAAHEDNEAEVQHPKSNPMADIDHYMAVKGAARYLKDLGYTHDYGDKHRDEAAHHHKMLQGVLGEGFGPVDEQDDTVNVQEPRGDVSVKSLLEQQKQMNAEIKEQERMLARLLPVLV
jgi:hypothetical protein